MKLLQAGVHVPRGTSYNGAKVKNWPEQTIPENFQFREEQKFKLRPMPRDTGKIPRDFVLSVLYRQQPCPVDQLWQKCAEDASCVLDSKRHLRDVLKAAREEGFLTFERGAQPGEWTCSIARERFQEVRAMVLQKVENMPGQMQSMRGSSATDTAAFAEAFRELNDEAKAEHLRKLTAEVAATTEKLKSFQRMEMDYLPYTDLNGKVQFMWWYEMRDQAAKAAETLPAGEEPLETEPAKVTESSAS